jgi:hypothetical protein
MILGLKTDRRYVRQVVLTTCADCAQRGRSVRVAFEIDDRQPLLRVMMRRVWRAIQPCRHSADCAPAHHNGGS